MKRLFKITTKEYQFDWGDITTIITLLNVSLVLMGFWWAPFLGIANCGLYIILGIIKGAYINSYVTQFALLVLNIYFLTL